MNRRTALASLALAGGALLTTGCDLHKIATFQYTDGGSVKSEAVGNGETGYYQVQAMTSCHYHLGGGYSVLGNWANGDTGAGKAADGYYYSHVYCGPGDTRSTPVSYRVRYRDVTLPGVGALR